MGLNPNDRNWPFLEGLEVKGLYGSDFDSDSCYGNPLRFRQHSGRCRRDPVSWSAVVVLAAAVDCQDLDAGGRC